MENFSMASFIIKERRALWVDFTCRIEARRAEESINRHFNGESDGIEMSVGDYVVRVIGGEPAVSAVDLFDPTNSDSARGEGWMLGALDEGLQRIVICDEDVDPEFASDADAERFVRERAAAGSELHRRAIALIEIAAVTASQDFTENAKSPTERRF
jgi:hypothetical protein